MVKKICRFIIHHIVETFIQNELRDRPPGITSGLVSVVCWVYGSITVGFKPTTLKSPSQTFVNVDPLFKSLFLILSHKWKMVVDPDACGHRDHSFWVFFVLFFHWKVKILEFIQGFRSFSLHNKVYGGRFRQIKGTVVVRLFYNAYVNFLPRGSCSIYVNEWTQKGWLSIKSRGRETWNV